MDKLIWEEKKDWFDIFEWEAPVYDGPEAVLRKFQSLGLIGRKFEGIYIVGAASNLTKVELEREKSTWMYRNDIDVSSAGQDSDNACAEMPMDCCVEICEPLVFVFEGGIRLELLPMYNGQMRIGVCSIPAEVREGTMHPNCEAEGILARNLVGAVIDDIGVFENKEIECSYSLNQNSNMGDYRTRWYLEKRKYRYSFRFKYDGINSHAGTLEMSIGVFSKPFIVERSDRNNKMPYKEICKHIYTENDQVDFQYGSNLTMDFYPCKRMKDGNSRDGYFKANMNFAYSFDDEGYSLLEEYLDLCFDKTIQSDEHEEDSFDYYGENVYTRSSMMRMLAAIRNDCIRLEKEKTQENAEKTERMLDFYERFYRCMMSMLKHCKEYDLIAFEGP